MREKLIKLISKVQDEGLDYSDYFTDSDSPNYIENSELAKFLIANGVEIPVHCCDCLKCTVIVNQVDGEPILFCEHWKGYPKVDPTDFCSYGERKDNG